MAFPMLKAGMRALLLEVVVSETATCCREAPITTSAAATLSSGACSSALDTKRCGPAVRHRRNSTRRDRDSPTRGSAPRSGSMGRRSRSSARWRAEGSPPSGAPAFSVYEEHDLADFPLSVSDLADSYRTLLAEALAPETGATTGPRRMAVLTARRGERLECNACNLCLWECARHAIYDASHDLPRLAAFETLDDRPGHLAHEIRNGSGAYRVGVRAPGGEYGSLSAPILVMAATTFATTRLVLAWQRRYSKRLPLVTSPGFALLLPTAQAGRSSSRRVRRRLA